MKPVTCFDHRHEKVQRESNKRKKGRKGWSPVAAAGASEVRARTPSSAAAGVILIESSDEEDNLRGATAQDVIRRWNTPRSLGARFAVSDSSAVVSPNR
jgi:hypothetical protein